jgi:hypothetical protein
VEGAGAMHGLWVILVKADNNGDSGPGLVTLSDIRGGGKVFLGDMETVVTTPGKMSRNTHKNPQQKVFLDDMATVATTPGQSFLLDSDSDDSDDGGFHVTAAKNSSRIILHDMETVATTLGDAPPSWKSRNKALHLSDSDDSDDSDDGFEFGQTTEHTANIRLQNQPPVPPATPDGRFTLETSNVAKYKLYTQVGQIGDGSMNGWWVVELIPENGGDSGPGLVTLACDKPSQRDMFIDAMVVANAKKTKEDGKKQGGETEAGSEKKKKKESLLSKGAGMLRSKSLFLQKQGEKLATKKAMNMVAEEQVRIWWDGSDPFLSLTLLVAHPFCFATIPLAHTLAHTLAGQERV